jgi:hypothetical protein
MCGCLIRFQPQVVEQAAIYPAREIVDFRCGIVGIEGNLTLQALSNSPHKPLTASA